MTDLTPFNYGDAEIRALSVNGEPWFIAADLCAQLDLTNVGQALTSLDDDEKSSITINDGTPGTPNRAIVSESGMYSLVLRSRKPEAKAFKRWITREVLPSIRRTGGYDTRSDHQVNALIFQARAQMELCQAAKGLIHPDHLEARARVVLARGLSEKPELDSGRRPLYTQDFLREKNLSQPRMRSVAGVFGKRVKAAYVLEYGCDPDRYPLNLSNGQVRYVNAYTEADRDLLEAVWQKHYAESA